MHVYATHILLTLGFLAISGAAVLHAIIVLRLRDIGTTTRVDLILGRGTFYCSRYLKVRRQYGWSPWFVYLIPPLMLCGLALIILGVSRL